MQLLATMQQIEQQRTAVRLSFAARPVHFPFAVSLSRFRTSPRYIGRPAAADMAFSIAACAQGWAEADIAAALRRDYFSRDTSKARQKRLHPTHRLQSASLGRLKQAWENPLRILPIPLSAIPTRSSQSAC